MQLILASASPRRADLLGRMKVKFTIKPSEAVEIFHHQLSSSELCRVNAFRKARAVARRHPRAIVLGADTLVFLDQHPLGKPANLREAAEMLLALQGRSHEVVTGVCLLRASPPQRLCFAEMTEVTFKPLTRKQVRAYLGRVNPLDKAGAYAIQEHGEHIIAAIRGSYTNVVGLPVEKLRAALQLWGLV